MKHSVALVLTLASGLALQAAAQTSSSPATATTTAAAGPVKIAIIAFQPAVAQTNEGQRAFSDLQKKYQPKQTQLKALSDEIDKLTKDLQAQADKLSDTERAARAKTIDDKKKQLERNAEDAQNDFQNEMNELYGSLAQKVFDVLNDYAKQHGYTLVLDIAQQQNPVLFATDSINITKPVIEAYNAKSGVPAPATPAPNAPSAVPSAPKPPATRPPAQ
ncbi:MAG TPA: OmpH family outer membrane protein [Terracidiphilus sp.]|nr:OmpH family outer membrane protein [Terracidiphilus sp.]